MGRRGPEFPDFEDVEAANKAAEQAAKHGVNPEDAEPATNSSGPTETENEGEQDVQKSPENNTNVPSYETSVKKGIQEVEAREQADIEGQNAKNNPEASLDAGLNTVWP